MNKKRELTDELITEAIKNDKLFSDRVECFEDEETCEYAEEIGSWELGGTTGKGFYTAHGHLQISKSDKDGIYEVNGRVMTDTIAISDVNTMDKLKAALCEVSEEMWDLCMCI